MHREKYLILNFIFVCLLVLLMIRDRLPSPYFQLSIFTKDKQSISVPIHLIHCRLGQKLHCEVPIIHQTLVVEEVEPPSLDCRARFDKQTPTCQWLQASALEYISIEDLELTPIQIASIKYSIKPFPTARIFDSPEANVSLLAFCWLIVTVLNGFNVTEFVYFYAQKFLPGQNRPTKRIIAVLLAAIAGLGAIVFLALSFIFLIMIFGYVN
ncbi:hypothetical protein NOS3756_38020 [Nostoc sp. NIES-3756]|uniref:hypothetical protein n=1 Tax=Nostoc sp. NIES-3756 TaxID=1751286 RepID=UPI00072253BF|nr:hypothetical protein [Nostoc sp. NIES-3756]BAT54827.1 hypothetical protein NOS3756_38020 [Nostoc sp. NIES-3756]